MANGIIAQAVNRISVGAALQAARIEAQEHQAWITAINKAALNLEACTWQFDGDDLRIESATNSGTYYTVTAAGCPCKAGAAGKACWHRASRRLLIKASELAELAQEMSIAEGLALADAMQAAAAELLPVTQYARSWDAWQATIERKAQELYD